VFWNDGEPVEIEWGGFGESVSSSREANALFRGNGNIVGDPHFADPASGDFSLRAASEAIDSGNSQLELQNSRFQEIFGIDVSIIADIGGGRRPLDGNHDGRPEYDVGSDEYDDQPVARMPHGE
ncbi:MAG: hypothetical protein ACREQ1_13465, partial [Woeseiaceae bacterium]